MIHFAAMSEMDLHRSGGSGIPSDGFRHFVPRGANFNSSEFSSGEEEEVASLGSDNSRRNSFQEEEEEQVRVLDQVI